MGQGDYLDWSAQGRYYLDRGHTDFYIINADQDSGTANKCVSKGSSGSPRGQVGLQWVK